MKKLLACVLILVTLPVGALAQQGQSPRQSVPVSDELGKALEKALAELETCRNRASLSKDELQAYKDQLEAAKALLANYKEDLRLANEALADRKKANTLDDKRVASYEASIKEYEKTINKLEGKISVLKFLVKAGVVVAFVVGAAVGVVVAK